MLAACGGGTINLTDGGVNNTTDDGSDDGGDTDDGNDDDGDNDDGNDDDGDNDDGNDDDGDTDDGPQLDRSPSSSLVQVSQALLIKNPFRLLSHTTRIQVHMTLELTAFGKGTVTLTEGNYAARFDGDGNIVEIFDNIYIVDFSDGPRITLSTIDDIPWEEAHQRNQGYDYLVPYVISYKSSRFSGTAEVSFDVLGDETSDMPDSGTAEYTGIAYSERYEGRTGSTATVGTYENVAVIQADFGTATVSGDLEGFFIDPTSITGNTFSSTLSVDESTCNNDCIEITDSNIDGTFFGTNAQEVGGSFTYTHESGFNDYYTLGYFTAKDASR